MKKRILQLGIILTLLLASPYALCESGKCYDIYDPHENLNRNVFTFNRTVDHVFFRPAVKVYHHVIPDWGQERVNSFFYNLKEPLSFINYVLQGKPVEASQTFWRFFINTLFGVGGLFDFASSFEIYVPQQTFGNTLMHYDINYGAYIMVPILGPYTTREFYGKVIDTFIDPTALLFDHKFEITPIEYNVTTSAQTRVKNDEFLEDIEKSSLDLYSKTRSLYIQSLAGKNQACKTKEERIDYDEDF